MSWMPLWDEEGGRARRGPHSEGGGKITDAATVNKTSETTLTFSTGSGGRVYETPLKRSGPSQQGVRNKNTQQQFNKKKWNSQVKI